MPYYLRAVRQNRWKKDFHPWINAGDFPIDPLFDLFVKNKGEVSQRLSVWEIDDHKSNLERVLAALAANRDNLDIFDFMLIDKDFITDIGFELSSSAGTTHDAEINVKYHHDISNLSLNKVCNFVKKVFEEGIGVKRKPRGKIKKILRNAIDKGWIDSDKIKFIKHL